MSGNICELCKRDFRSFQGLYRHILSGAHENIEIHIIHKGEYNCDQCNRQFNSDFLLQQHKKTQLYKRGCKSPQHICDQCNKVCQSKYALKIHKQTNFYKNGCINSPKTYTCDQCSKIFHSKRDFNRHKKTKFFSNGCIKKN